MIVKAIGDLNSAHKGDSGFDVYIKSFSKVFVACMGHESVKEDYDEEELTLRPLERVLIGTGVKLELPKFINVGNKYLDVLECQARPKSGRSLDGLNVSWGTIDNEYTGEVMITVTNLSPVDKTIKKGQKIAQLVFAKIVKPTLIKVEEIENTTTRGTNGHGSTGL